MQQKQKPQHREVAIKTTIKAIQQISRLSVTKMKTNTILSQFSSPPWHCFLWTVHPINHILIRWKCLPWHSWVWSTQLPQFHAHCPAFHGENLLGSNSLKMSMAFSADWLRKVSRSLCAKYVLTTWSSFSVFLPQQTAIYAAVSCCSATPLLFTLDQCSPRTTGTLLEHCQEVNTAGRAINAGALDRGQEQANRKEHNHASVNNCISK